jgi:aminoglycoside 3-N-acetyltransferase
MIREVCAKYLTQAQKRAVKTQLNRFTRLLADSLWRYDAEALKKALKKIGISETDTVMVHANFNPASGFKGAPQDIVNALVELVGRAGNLLMVSIPFRGSAYEYLSKNKPFYVNRTLSMMGLVTEVFRKKTGVLRSLHPTHPVLAYGKDSTWLVADHERCLFPCGSGTPFEKFRQLKGKILFFDVGFEAITFFHHVEDLTKSMLPFNVYAEERFVATTFDGENRQQLVETYAFNPRIARNAAKLAAAMAAQGKVRKTTVGRSSLLLVEAEDVVACQTEMISAGNLPYDIDRGT